MSKKEDMRYELERQRRQELFEARVRETAQRFLQRHEALLDDLRTQGIDAGVATEVRQARQDLERAHALLRSDPAAARTLSMEIGSRLHGLPAQARATFRAAREAELQAHAHAEQVALQGLEAAWRDRLSAWEDPLARELAAPALARLRRELLQRGQTATLSDLDAGLSQVQAEAKAGADAVRAQAAREAEAHAAQALRAELQAVGAAPVDVSASPQALSQALAQAVEREDDAAVGEAVRREVVRAVNQALLDAGFVVEKPRRVHEADMDEVVLRAARPSGAEAVFRVDLSGAMHYEFDRYEGTSCRKDIDQVLPSLESVYGIRLSERRVIWENPDDLQQDARPRPDTERSNTRG
ncbi:hypothetical protein ACG02S_16485 [Roseateles sp. DC23W]|uniref:Uncharacterized protein n=1 Tax=Pelomonas dachongensis TaxID=3299029 RepID=A0ABW7EQ05_9BURK